MDLELVACDISSILSQSARWLMGKHQEKKPHRFAAQQKYNLFLFKLDSEILTDALLPQTQSKFLNLSPSLIALFTNEEDIFAAKVLKYEFILLGY
jgi:hypothetical protein